MPPPPKTDLPSLAARALPVSWCAFLCSWFYAVFFWAMFVAWTPIAFASYFDMDLVTWCIWMFLAFGVVISVAGCAVAWVVVLVDPFGYILPRLPTNRGWAADP